MFADNSNAATIISMEPFTTNFSLSKTDATRLIDNFRNGSMSPDDFFEIPRINDTFYYCLLLEGVDDNFVESRERIGYFIMSQNEKDLFGNTSSATVEVEIIDNDGRL